MVKNKKLRQDEKPVGSDQFGNMPSDFPVNNAPSFNVDGQNASKAYYDWRKSQMGFEGSGDFNKLTPEEKIRAQNAPLNANTPAVNLLKLNQELNNVQVPQNPQVNMENLNPTQQKIIQQNLLPNTDMGDSGITITAGADETKLKRGAQKTSDILSVAPPIAMANTLIDAGKSIATGEIGEQTAGLFKTGAEIYDFINSLFSEGKSIKQKEAESTLNQVMADLSSDIALVKTGEKNPQIVREKIKMANQALNRLDESVKGLGKLNLRYWLIDGKDVQTKLSNERDNLNDYSELLLRAQAEGAQNSLIRKYGVKPTAQ